MRSASEKDSVKTLGGCGERKRRSPLIQLLVYLLIGSIITYRNSVDHYQSSVCHQKNGQCESLVWFWCLSPSFPPSRLPLPRSRAAYFCLTLFSRQPYYLRTWKKLLSFCGWSLHQTPNFKIFFHNPNNFIKILIFLPIFEVFFIVRLSSKY